MVVLSLFDGISCGRVALERAGIPVTAYYACEIDKHAIKVSSSTWPDIIPLGSVTDLYNWVISVLPKIDLLIGGSPCQGFSFAGKQLNFNDPRSALFFEFVRIWKAVKLRNPKAKFLLENVLMKAEYRDVITGLMGVEPILINSALVSAQNRRRLYWTNISEVQQPDNAEIYLDHILEGDAYPICCTERRTEEEARAIRRESMKAGRDFSPRRGKELVARTDRKSNCLTATFSEKEHMVMLKLPCIRSYDQLIYRPDKSQCLDANYHKGADNHGQRTGFVLVPPDLIGLEAGDLIPVDLSQWRKLSPVECERLQGLPDNYTNGISDTQRYKCLGNGWQVDTIVHIFKNLI